MPFPLQKSLKKIGLNPSIRRNGNSSATIITHKNGVIQLNSFQQRSGTNVLSRNDPKNSYRTFLEAGYLLDKMVARKTRPRNGPEPRLSEKSGALASP